MVSLLKNFSAIPITEGDAFGKIYEYFLGVCDGRGTEGWRVLHPISIVKLIVEIIEPYHGRILDPACGSGGMFVQSAAFVEHHKKNVNEISIYGQEKVAETIRLCKMNLAVHGLSETIESPNHCNRRRSTATPSPIMVPQRSAFSLGRQTEKRHGG